MPAELIRVRGLVQGVGFRPTVWRLAHDLDLTGDVRNDGEGVLIRIQAGADASPESLDQFCERLRVECPPLARIDTIERAPLGDRLPTDSFLILASDATEIQTGIVPDAATCTACAAEIRDLANRRYRYPFTNCTHCGPRLSIVASIPYDRARTSMAVFPMCPACAAEYADPSDRRFHAQPNACPDCGPRIWLVDAEGRELDPAGFAAADAIAAASRLLAEGRILAIKGIGGFHLACDATNDAAVAELRRRKRRFAKPFALMARDLDVIRDHCRVSQEEAALLTSPAAPILLLERSASASRHLASQIAPGQTTLGFMLPYSPLHHLLLADWDRPLIMTSGNLSDEPQSIDNLDAMRRLHGLADVSLLHDRAIINRVDDSVVRVMAGAPRLLRRARGYAPATLQLPPGFERMPSVLAFGGELKNTICLTRDGQAVLSQHLGDLEEARTAREYEDSIRLYRELFQHRPQRLAVDLHPDYRSSLIGREQAVRAGLPLIGVQHHHAHLASVLADNGWPLAGGPVLGILLDGLGYGDDGTLWGGEWLVGDYRGYRRVGHLKPVAMPGGAQAILEPWRNLFAQLEAADGWDAMQSRYPDLEVIRRLAGKPLGLLRTLIQRGLNAPLSSSAGRLFDAVAAALGPGGERMLYEGQAAIELEALAAGAMASVGTGYHFAICAETSAMILDAAPMWGALCDDLAQGVAHEQIAARFHAGFAAAIVDLAVTLAGRHGLGTVALSGGVMQNRILLEALDTGLRGAGLRVLIQRQVPANDGGLALGQACIAAAR
ncbi:carbamoyltransferase HypF [Thiobaca trueperi]|uniref:Carbamoyltransferase HypF n=1 Tax=Thiobaca trueperi TaxID=127458 RepID=A0A4R3N0T0_9GAMM|nr:carbamoyltransferase HypF [Thiobaca trueperi]TCT20209.1 hydrogenase maturation protein HypF [Thiobaca trueperi]